MKPIIQGSAEWLRLRKNYIGASDAPVIMHVSPWKTPYQLWQEKLGLADHDQSNFFTRRGLELEPVARRQFEKLTGLLMFPEVRFSSEKPFIMASLDGIDLEGKHAVEIKCAGPEDHEKALNNQIPEKYYPQLQHQLYVLNLEMIFYFSFNGSEGKIIEVKRDEKYITQLIEMECSFYKLIQDLLAPEMTNRDYVEKKEEQWLATTNRYLCLEAEIEALEKEKNDLKDQLIGLTNGKNCAGGGIKLTQVIRKGMIDYNAIPELRNVNLESYRKAPIASWRIIKS